MSLDDPLTTAAVTRHRAGPSLLLFLVLGLVPGLIPGVGCTPGDKGDTGESTDGGVSDGGPTDGGTEADGGTETDGGTTDGGTTDGGTATDGGAATDGGTVVVDGPPAVILMIGDGMGFEHVRGGGLFANGAAGSLVMETLPVQGRIQTASRSGLTDSAASATAMSTGAKTWNSVLGRDGEGEDLLDLADDARSVDMAVGLVTSDKLYGATPAAFAANVDSRHDTTGIVDDVVANPPDIMLGGGAGSLAEPLAKAGVVVITDIDELAAADLTALPLAGLFADIELPFVADEPDALPTLDTLASTALAALEPDPEGFFLMVEGARIDHASHGNNQTRVHAETAAFDAAVASVVAWADAHPERPVTVIVTADHECGGLGLTDKPSAAGEVPETTWLWGDHTNADVPVFARGPHTDVLHDQRLHNLWVHAVLQAALFQADSVTEPVLPRLADGDTTDLGGAVAFQAHDSSFGSGYNQLDALHLTADEDGLWVGIDGVVDSEANAVFVMLDLDFGQGTGVGRDGVTLADVDGDLDTVLTQLDLSPGLDGLGFDAAVGSLHATYVKVGDLKEGAGLRGFVDPWGDIDDIWWLRSAINYDSGNMAMHGEPAADAGAVGDTEGGIEVWIPWWDLYPDGLPDEGQSIAVAVVLANDDGTSISNQVLPALESEDAPGGALEVSRVVVLEIDGDGVAVGGAAVVE